MNKRSKLGPKPSERRRRREETKESRLFRDCMMMQIMEERSPGMVRDLRKLATISRPVALVRRDDEVFILIEPPDGVDDHMDFDRAVCGAGVKKFVRRTMPSDLLGRGTPINPRIGKPDPTIERPEIPADCYGPYLLVEELCPGLRAKSGFGFTHYFGLIRFSRAP